MGVRIHLTSFIRDFRFPQEHRIPQIMSMLVPTIKTCARGCFVRLRWLPSVLGAHPRPFTVVEMVVNGSFDGVSVENCRWTVFPLGEWTLRSNNARTVVSKLLDWMFGIIPSSRKLCPS